MNKNKLKAIKDTAIIAAGASFIMGVWGGLIALCSYLDSPAPLLLVGAMALLYGIYSSSLQQYENEDTEQQEQ
jgi:4-hydroxybenzoate polyprenyltransferase